MKVPRKKKRDMQASSKTLTYFLTTRQGKPTTVQHAAWALRVSSKGITRMASRLQREGKLVRFHRGVYGGPQLAQALPLPPPDGDQQLLDALLKEREHLDAQIEKVRAVIEMKKLRKAGGGK